MKPTYYDVQSIEHAIELGYDLCAIKYDGRYVELDVDAGGQVDIDNGKGQIIMHAAEELAGFGWEPGRYRAEWMVGTTRSKDHTGPEFMVWDRIDSDLGFIMRRSKCDVLTYGIASAHAIWKRQIVENNHEGLVFYKSTGGIDEPLARLKRTFTKDYKVMVITATSLLCGDGEDVLCKCRVSAQVRDQAKIGRWVELEGNQVFDSGALRHPRFYRWRDDK